VATRDMPFGDDADPAPRPGGGRRGPRAGQAETRKDVREYVVKAGRIAPEMDRPSHWSSAAPAGRRKRPPFARPSRRSCATAVNTSSDGWHLLANRRERAGAGPPERRPRVEGRPRPGGGEMIRALSLRAAPFRPTSGPRWRPRSRQAGRGTRATTPMPY
jgi:hypothetical protein